MLHLDGVLCVGLRVVELGDIHRGLLGLVWGSGLWEEKPRPMLSTVQGKPSREKVQLKPCPPEEMGLQSQSSVPRAPVFFMMYSACKLKKHSLDIRYSRYGTSLLFHVQF